jgi:hypothetical protein
MVGVTHFVSPSSLFLDRLDAGICSRRTQRMASGGSRDSRLERREYVAKSVLVLLHL